MQIERGVHAMEQKAATDRERAEADFLANERAKNARYEQLTVVKGV